MFTYSLLLALVFIFSSLTFLQTDLVHVLNTLSWLDLSGISEIAKRLEKKKNSVYVSTGAARAFTLYD